MNEIQRLQHTTECTPCLRFSPSPVLSSLGVCLIIALVVVQFASAQTVEIPDPNLEQAIRNALALPDETPLTQSKMEQLTRLIAGESQIENLTGLEYAINLKWLNVSNNNISDITPLANLTQLEELWLFINPISDISPLANLPLLRGLNMGACRVSDLTPLTNLTRLEELYFHYNKISDLTPLANLTQLKTLYLNYNQISDITPLIGLTQLEKLKIEQNRIRDYSPFDKLSISDLSFDEICELSGLPIQERLQNRSFPSIFQAWTGLIDDSLPEDDRTALHDLAFGPEFGLGWVETSQGIRLAGNLAEAQAKRDVLLAKNPNLLILSDIAMRDAFPDNYYREDWPYWLRDEAGNRVVGWPKAYLIDFTNPGAQDVIVQQAVAVSKCGLFDGIMFDWWTETGIILKGYRSLEAEQRARDAIIQAVRAAVGPNVLIIVNNNDGKFPRTAPYINGSFMETHPDLRSGYPLYELMRIESTLLWSEENSREPQINCLEGWGYGDEARNSPKHRRWMRVFTTLSLTHSDGYVLYAVGISHSHIWYKFWEADLGRPIGAKGQRYQDRDGVFIREFTNGWAVYNRSGDAQEIRLPVHTTGVESKQNGKTHTLPDLDGGIYLKTSAPSPYDVNGDRQINILDLVIVSNQFGKPGGDVNGDGTTNIFDLILVANHFD